MNTTNNNGNNTNTYKTPTSPIGPNGGAYISFKDKNGNDHVAFCVAYKGVYITVKSPKKTSKDGKEQTVVPVSFAVKGDYAIDVITKHFPNAPKNSDGSIWVNATIWGRDADMVVAAAEQAEKDPAIGRRTVKATLAGYLFMNEWTNGEKSGVQVELRVQLVDNVTAHAKQTVPQQQYAAPQAVPQQAIPQAAPQYAAPQYQQPPVQQAAPQYQQPPVQQAAPQYQQPPVQQAAPQYQQPPVQQAAPQYQQPSVQQPTQQYQPAGPSYRDSGADFEIIEGDDDTLPF